MGDGFLWDRVGMGAGTTGSVGMNISSCPHAEASMDIHVKSLDMNMGIDAKVHIHGKPDVSYLGIP